MKIEINNLNEIESAAKQFVSVIGDKKVFAFYGLMGAGKTTFIKAVCKELGVEETITSPTFAIVNEYKSGSIVTDNKTYLHVASTDGYVNVLSLQLAGKKRMPVADFLRGFHASDSTTLI